jgi:hypothetical protein
MLAVILDYLDVTIDFWGFTIGQIAEGLVVLILKQYRSSIKSLAKESAPKGLDLI